MSTETLEKVEVVSPKAKSPSIRSSIYHWFDEACSQDTPEAKAEALKALQFDEFVGRVLAINPDWSIKDNVKRMKSHFNWYKGDYKKRHSIPSATRVRRDSTQVTA